jgi:hypothetical protein
VTASAPLVVTAALDAVAQERLDRLRQAHFPPARNHLPAHLTLFHALPGEHLDAVRADVAEVAGMAEVAGPAPYDAVVSGLRSLGGGVAFDITCPALVGVRDELRRRWLPWLTRQDAQPWRPHVTVQNKVPADRARALLAELSDGFEPWPFRVEGLQLWWYRGGPWEPVPPASVD